MNKLVAKQKRKLSADPLFKLQSRMVEQIESWADPTIVAPVPEIMDRARQLQGREHLIPDPVTEAPKLAVQETVYRETTEDGVTQPAIEHVT